MGLSDGLMASGAFKSAPTWALWAVNVLQGTVPVQYCTGILPSHPQSTFMQQFEIAPEPPELNESSIETSVVGTGTDQSLRGYP